MIISLIIPAFNEEHNIFPLYKRLVNVLRTLEENYEIIYVDDGSRDLTVEKIKLLIKKDPNIKLISFSRNFGHQMAITAGLRHSTGEAVIVMDADLQHPPEVIPELIAKWKEGYEVVSTIRKHTHGASLIKRITSKLFYKTINLISDTGITANAADYRLMSRKTVTHLNSLKEQSRFIRGLTSWLGFSQTWIEIEVPERLSGESKYSLKRMLRFASQGVISFSNYPLVVSFYMGLFISFLCFLYILYSIYAHFVLNSTLPGWTSIMITALFLGGLMLIVLGILGIYIGQILIELRKRPQYVINETVGFNSNLTESSG